ncbi:DUF2007 domain-containing protein [Tenacibaculum sp. IB213877]|uniref:putative signal transducing protein n=1 Tax=Tenacibaculum sp. IB213877 TaxID=3097351 RepID=UPI002A5A80F4|nr:DUF2007 domain-containing protein [Tenacibaculum sp. IB213877]MDY0780136.1 DUF2007 domain-containing protein [Tenacibaculum sp. IB213877]
MNEHIKIYTGSSILVNRLAELLTQSGIPSIIKDEKESGRLAGFGTLGDTCELFIFKSDKDKALPLLTDFKKEISK